MSDQNKNVATPSAAYEAQRKLWDLIEDLLAGTFAMRSAGTKWLPRSEKHEKSYQSRLGRSFLFMALADTIERYASKPFSQPVKFTQDETPEFLAPIVENMDNAGTGLTQFARELFEAAVAHGHSFILVDHTGGEFENRAQEIAAGARPVLIHVRAPNLIGWRTVKEKGKTVLDMIRIREVVEEPDGPYNTQEIEQIRVYTREGWEVHRQDDGPQSEWVLHAQGGNTLGEVPLIACYTSKDGFMISKPALQGLAETNLEHWQSHSDQRNILHFARGGVLFLKGFAKTDENGDPIDLSVPVGANAQIDADSEHADAKYVEHKGQSITAGENDLRHLEERMERQGLAPLIRKTGTQTATGQAIDAKNSDSDVHAWVQMIEQALKEAFILAARWQGLENSLGEEFGINIYSEFTSGLSDEKEIEYLIAMRQAREISREDFYLELEQRGFFREGIDVDEMMDRLEEEGDPLGGLSNFPEGGNEDEDDDDDQE